MAVGDVAIKKAVKRFLSDGSLGGMPVRDLANACDRLVRAETQCSTVSSVALARQFADRAQMHGGVLYVTALRALGWALLVSGRFREAKEAYLSARTLVTRQAHDRAGIDRVLIDVYMYLGDYSEARRHARLALRTFRRLKAEADVAKTQVNYANVLHRQDRHREANRLYKRAGDFFAHRGQVLAAALCDYNLANTHVQLLDFAAAGLLYSRARRTFLRHGHQLHATGCLYGLAWLHMLEGDFRTALLELADCEREYRRGKQLRELTLCQLDRAESYLGLNLFVDAGNAAREAARSARSLGIEYEAAKADFFLGKASVGLGRHREAMSCLRRAERGFRKSNNHGFLGAVQLTVAQLEKHRSHQRSKIEIARRRFRKAQLPLWEAICDLQIAANRLNDPKAIRRLARNQAVRVVPHLEAQRHLVLGDREASRQRMKSAVDYWTRAADILDALRTKLAPVEMRSAFLHRQSNPFGKLIDVQSERSPIEAAVFSERYKTAGVWSAPPDVIQANPMRARVQQSLHELAGHVTALSSMIPEPGGRRGVSVAGQEAPLIRLQRRIRLSLARLETLDAGIRKDNDALAGQFKSVSHRLPIVQFHVGEKDVIAFVHYRGDTLVYRYLDGVDVVENLAARWRYHAETTHFNGRSRRRDLEDEGRVLAQIGAWLLPPLELPPAEGRLLILAEGVMTRLPWQAISDGPRPLAERFELIFAPSLRHYLYACRRQTKSKAARIYVGQTLGLPQSGTEVRTLSARLQSLETQVYNPCRRSDWPDTSSARIWHFVGHAHLRSDNPFYSSLLTADGPLFAADFRLKRNRVDLVTLAACRTGQQTSLPGEEASGLVRSLLEMGARNVVGSNWAVSDQSTSMWTDLLYRHFLAGSSPAAAVRLAAVGVRERFPSAFHWGAFSVAGAG